MRFVFGNRYSVAEEVDREESSTLWPVISFLGGVGFGH